MTGIPLDPHRLVRRWWSSVQSAESRTLDVTGRYGARGDGRTDDTRAVRDAVADAAPGDVVLFPPDRTYLIDAVDLGEVASRDLTLMCHGATIRKNPAGTFGRSNTEHVFFDRRGLSNGLRVIGGRFELSRGAATAGDTASAFFLVRCDDLFFGLVEIVDGIEEGAKLYKCRDVTWVHPLISRCRNNGIQCHSPARDGHSGDVPNRGWADWRVYGGVIEDIDDDRAGQSDGQGITFNNTDPDVACRSALVEGVTLRRCLRGLWAEFNQPETRGSDIRFRNNLVEEARWLGIGQVGVLDSEIAGNQVFDVGYRSPGTDTSSDVSGIIVAGTAEGPSERIVVSGNRIEDTRPDPWMRFGITLRQCRDVVVERNEIEGATSGEYRIDSTARGTVNGVSH